MAVVTRKLKAKEAQLAALKSLPMSQEIEEEKQALLATISQLRREKSALKPPTERVSSLKQTLSAKELKYQHAQEALEKAQNAVVDAQQHLADAETELATVRADLASAEQAAAMEDAEDDSRLRESLPTLAQDQDSLVAMLQRRFLSQHDQSMIPHLLRIMGIEPPAIFSNVESPTPERTAPTTPGNRFSTPVRPLGYGSLLSPSYGGSGAAQGTKPRSRERSREERRAAPTPLGTATPRIPPVPQSLSTKRTADGLPLADSPAEDALIRAALQNAAGPRKRAQSETRSRAMTAFAPYSQPRQQQAAGETPATTDAYLDCLGTASLHGKK